MQEFFNAIRGKKNKADWVNYFVIVPKSLLKSNLENFYLKPSILPQD